MAAIAGSLFQLHEKRVEQLVSSAITVFMPTLDPFWTDVVTTTQGVTRASQFGQNWDLIRVFFGGLTGTIEQGRPRADFPLHGDDTDTFGAKLHFQNIVQEFPSVDNDLNQSPYALRIPMRSMVANIKFTLGELVAESNPGFIGEIVAPKLSAFGMHWAHIISSYWYLSQNQNYRLCRLANTVIDSVNNLVTFTPDNKATDRFQVGYKVDIYEGTAGAVRKNNANGAITHDNRIELAVVAVNGLTNVVTLKSTADPAGWANSDNGGDNPANGDEVVFANSRDATAGFTGTAGINSYLKTGIPGDTIILGGEAHATDRIDVSLHPEFASYKKDLAGSPLTELQVIKTIRGFNRGKQMLGQYVDCAFTTDGVLTQYYSELIGRERIDRTNRLASTQAQGLSGNALKSQLSVSVDGRDIMFYVSNMVPEGEVYFTRKGGNNWQVHVPPDIPGSERASQVPKGLPFCFVGRILGMPTAKIPVYRTSSGDAGATNRVTEAVQVPGWLRMQVAPQHQFTGIKMLNVAELRELSDTT